MLKKAFIASAILALVAPAVRADLRPDAVKRVALVSGALSGVASEHKYGTNSSVAAVEEDIWASTGAYPFPTVARTVRVRVGGNAADDKDGGAGAREVTVSGLDQNWVAAEDRLLPDGALASAPSTVTFIRVFRAYVSLAGTYGAANTGAIIIEETGGGTELAHIAAGMGQTQQAIWTVPAGETAYLTGVFASVESAQQAAVRVWRREAADDIITPFSGGKRVVFVAEGLQGAMNAHFDVPPSFPEKTDIWASAIGPAGGASVTVVLEIVREQ